MVPTHIIDVEAIPIGPTGKADKSQLPQPKQGLARCDSAEAGLFHGEFEQKLAGIWEEVLGRSDFGRYDDFFLLGGSSLKALEVFSRIEKLFGLNVPLAVLLQKSTIVALGKQLDELSSLGNEQNNEGARKVDWDSLVVLIDKKSKVSPIVCVHAVGGNVLSYRGFLYFQEAQRPVVGFQSRSLNGRTEPHSSLEEMAADYVDELLAAGYAGTFTLMGGSMGGNVALEMAHRLTDLGIAVDWVILLDTFGPHARHLPDYIPHTNLLRRFLTSLEARTVYYGKNLLVGIHRAMGRQLPYRLRPFWIEEKHKRALRDHTDAPYEGNVLLIRAPEQRGLVYKTPVLGWEGFLNGKLVVDYVDVEHEAFMESDIVHDILHCFLLSNETENQTRFDNDD
jgi:thioesterase domain-containing protein/acyl carrier protein